MHRVLAVAVGIAAALVALGIGGGPWARTTFEDARTKGSEYGTVTVELSGDVDVHGMIDLSVHESDFQSDEPTGMVLRDTVGGTLPQLVQILAVLVAVIAAVGAFLDLTPRTWTLMASASLALLLATVILRDRTVAALSEATASLDAGVPLHTGGTGWTGLVIGAAAVATLAATLAAAPRPATTDLIADPADPEATTAADVGGLRGRLGFPSRGRATQQLP
jgi:hypothetical protein